MKRILFILFALLPLAAQAQLDPCIASGDTTNTTYTCSSKGTGSFNIQTVGAGTINFLTTATNRLTLAAAGGLTNTGTFTSSDDIRLANTKSLTGTIAAGGSYVDMVTLDGTDNTEVNAKTGKELQLQVNSTDEVVVTGSAVTIGSNDLALTSGSATIGGTLGVTGAATLTGGFKYPAAIMETGAAAGNSAGTALALSATKFIHLATGADETTGVKLPACAAGDVGKIHFIMNSVANKFMVVWPDGTDNINGLGAGAQYNTGASGEGRDTTMCACQAAGVWYCG